MIGRAGDGETFAASLVPSAIVAMAATRLVALLEASGVKNLEAKQRAAIIDSLVESNSPAGMSPRARDIVRRAAHKVGGNVTPDHPAWASMATTRGAVSLSLWQTALEVAVEHGGIELCTAVAGKACDHQFTGFGSRWTHFIQNLRRSDNRSVFEVETSYAQADPMIKLRNRLIHGKSTDDDRVALEATPPEVLVAPLFKLRDHVALATLAAAFKDPEPATTRDRALLAALGIDLEILNVMRQA